MILLTLGGVYWGQKMNGQSLYHFNPHTSFWRCIKSTNDKQNEYRKASQSVPKGWRIITICILLFFRSFRLINKFKSSIGYKLIPNFFFICISTHTQTDTHTVAPSLYSKACWVSLRSLHSNDYIPPLTVITPSFTSLVSFTSNSLLSYVFPN